MLAAEEDSGFVIHEHHTRVACSGVVCEHKCRHCGFSNVSIWCSSANSLIHECKDESGQPVLRYMANVATREVQREIIIPLSHRI